MKHSQVILIACVATSTLVSAAPAGRAQEFKSIAHNAGKALDHAGSIATIAGTLTTIVEAAKQAREFDDEALSARAAKSRFKLAAHKAGKALEHATTIATVAGTVNALVQSNNQAREYDDEILFGRQQEFDEDLFARAVEDELKARGWRASDLKDPRDFKDDLEARNFDDYEFYTRDFDDLDPNARDFEDDLEIRSDTRNTLGSSRGKKPQGNDSGDVHWQRNFLEELEELD